MPAAFAALSPVAGCTLMRAKRDRELLGQTSPIVGTVSGLSDKPACVALCQTEAGSTNRTLAAYQIVYKGGPFSFQRKPGELRE